MRLLRRLSLAACILAAAFAGGVAHAAPKFRVVYSFTGGADGSTPISQLVLDRSGNIYGVTFSGGAHGGGTVFRLTRQGALSVVYAGSSSTDSPNTMSGIAAAGDGTFYVTSRYGGRFSAGSLNNRGCGTVFRVSPEGGAKVLLNLKCGSKGQLPIYPGVLRRNGEYFATAIATASDGQTQTPVLFKLAAEGGRANVVHNFSEVGWAGYGGLAIDKNANIFGMVGVPTSDQVNPSYWTTVYKIDRGTNAYTPLLTFNDHAGGGLIVDDAGNLYGTAWDSIFKISADGAITTLYRFPTDRFRYDGPLANGQIARDEAGNIYGTTNFGGATCRCGSIYKLSPDGALHTLYTFTRGADGELPWGGLTMDKKGRLFGTAEFGAHANGVIFELDP